ncbi:MULTISPECIES: hypothetical protein [unclassified Pseudomonas]|uniref:hypothetical protein n=1 Tax=unclassified Pseudomonas TaxID=196821 RepID=UPI0008D4A0EF|nr:MULTISPECIES: hypothetical protein [unclassified Pseudomonas]PMV26764.1 type III secretion protein [Pseudomonas sp. FW305-3-2-15-C-TSA2]PMV32135.1 type III secretion protein [Pseudomonas sp. DP16D-L5]PMV41068.1 type III secretion protein [Pseudomonas sp. FW305-3-2-15-A-LB2]PMV48303.1 type III secretion protein [Pseudomonas sp. FW305-3-2-15-C-R2A1]PMV54760.1 type III secretion protein [Pseudomonas sp. FW305-3-2-15-C-LB1]
MRIKETYFSDQSDSDGVTYSASEQPVSGSDASFFSSMLEGSSDAKAVPSRSAAPQLFIEASNQLSASMNRFTKLVRAPKKELDFEVYKTFPRDFFNAQLTPHLLTKCLAKTTQGLDKICNLQ